MIGSPGPAGRGRDDATVELGAALPALDLGGVYGSGYCGYGFRLGYSWRDYLLFEGEYSHYLDVHESHTQSLFLAGIRAGLRKRRLGAFVKLQPGMIRAVKSYYLHYPDFTKFKFALSAGGVAEGHLGSHTYVRFDLGYLVIWYGDATLNFDGGSPLRPGTSLHPHWSIGVGFRL